MRLTAYTQSLNEGEQRVVLSQASRPSLTEGLVVEIDRLARHRLQAVQQQQSFSLLLAQVFDNWPQPVCAFGESTILVYANRTARELRGISLLLGARAGDMGFVFSDNQLHHPSLQKGWQNQSIRYRLAEEDYWLFIANDISLPLHQSEMIIQNNLVRVLSHELRNSLTPMASMTDTLLEMQSWPPEQVRQVLDRVRQRARGLLNFVQRFASVSQVPQPRQEWFDLSSLVEQSRSLLPGGTELSFFGEHRCHGDPILLGQVLMNLVKNAVEAQLKPESEIQVRFFHADGMQFLMVEDQGEGFANLDNALTPLYTTKAEGAGIGLALVNMIVARHGGRIRITNRPEGGASVELSWPLTIRSP
ncbi:hypothetical protein GCM10027098_23050 [Bowmanella dokdonensis]